MRIKCFAKVNIALNILNKRNDGYYNIESIMQTVNLFDVLEIELAKKLSVNSNNCDLPNDNRNLAYKAAEKFFDKKIEKNKVKIFIKKNIPIGAGLGGGSSDAAGVLKALNQLFLYPFNFQEICSIASSLGSDVAYFLFGSTALITGKGDMITRLEKFNFFHCLIVKPNFSIKTSWCYKNFKLNLINKNEMANIPIILKNIKKINQANEKKTLDDHNENEPQLFETKIDFYIKEIFNNSKNVFEKLLLKKYPILSEYKKFLKQQGALFSLVTGSGSCVYGLFDDLKLCKNAFIKFKEMKVKAWICETI
ncbi:MAG: 4-(cytidine 5'-diphospho)-2-C-methyl-D-erythritol kinase [Clostridiales bacterium]|jgi:4-diphosphocytidyl-2-C-methyl-D-erythritol kinase|nr:4-(cytidine 5'-diphospho)-2-C-methyl-D-erythritol kinase [Clostridiales bacterium]